MNRPGVGHVLAGARPVGVGVLCGWPCCRSPVSCLEDNPVSSRPTRRPRNGSRRGAPDPGALARLTAARDNLDADLAAARLREDELLAEYVTIEAAAAEVATRRDTALAELDRKAQAVRAEADDAAVEARRGEVLMRLSQRRSGEELHALVGLPLRRIRRVLQMHRQLADGDPAGVQAVAGRSPGPAASPAGAVTKPPTAPRSDPEDAASPVSVLPTDERDAPSSSVTESASDAVAREQH
jgi:hypothetical protein